MQVQYWLSLLSIDTYSTCQEATESNDEKQVKNSRANYGSQANVSFSNEHTYKGEVCGDDNMIQYAKSLQTETTPKQR